MEVRSEKDLAERIRFLGDNLKKRLWVASPYIGDFKTARSVIGRRWLEDSSIDVRLITDIYENNGLNPETIKQFSDRGKIKTIKGLHAKIYVLDNWAIVTSANLTRTSFAKRYEVGVFLTKRESKPLVELYDKWWKTKAKDIPADWKPRTQGKKGKDGELWGEKLPELRQLPLDPGDPTERISGAALHYELFLKCYSEFAKIYSKVQRLWKTKPLYFETDAFLNYLFHHHAGKPSKRYKYSSPRNLTEVQREQEIKKYAIPFKKWLAGGSEGVETSGFRESSSRAVRGILRKNNVEKIGKKEIREVAESFNSFNSVPLAREMFLRNNSPRNIRKAWKELLYNEKVPLQIRISRCRNQLPRFGDASIGEILGFFKPNKFPLRNANSISGLRFFGYNIPLH